MELVSSSLCSVLFIYEYLITIDKEVQYLYSGTRWTGAAALFWLNRYLSLIAFVADFVIYAELSRKVCISVVSVFKCWADSIL